MQVQKLIRVSEAKDPLGVLLRQDLLYFLVNVSHAHEVSIL
jgi:hypothetical protein